MSERRAWSSGWGLKNVTLVHQLTLQTKMNMHHQLMNTHTQLLLNSLALWLAMFSVSRVNSSSPSRESGCCRCCCGDGCRGDVEDCVTCDLCILSCCLTCSLYGES